ncbi:hypothetical protein [Nocardioides sp.]|uniref:hypothetical protein n=1 Tax=Nocardioides sp. TaxID=35761 RepID=UPI002608F971|nr:hypothetical protein [Nocardioides sp.]
MDQHDLWLLGSFTLSAEVLEQRGERYWAWESKFLTGDGYLIPLTSSADEIQQIVRDKPRDSRAERDAAQRAREALEYGDFERAAGEMEASEVAQAETRLRIKLVCGECRRPRTLRSDSVQPIVGKLWEVGVKELGFTTFLARVDRRT